VLASLKPLTRHQGVNGFGAEPLSPGHFRIVMRTVVDDDYTPGRELPGKGSDRYQRLLAAVRTARSTRSYASRGNYSVRLNGKLGMVSRAEADFVGERFVGDGFHVVGDGVLVGQRFKDGDKLCRRVYRPAAEKPNNPLSESGVQANFVTEMEVVDVRYVRGEKLETRRWQPISNGHIDISDGPNP
jgi:hypothetical protein